RSAQPEVPRRLELRRQSAERLVDRRSSIRIGHAAERDVRPVVVVERAALVEEIEHVQRELDLAGAAELDGVRRLQVDLAFERRPGLKRRRGEQVAVRVVLHQDPGTARTRRNLATVRVVRVRRQLGQRLTRREIQRETHIEPDWEDIAAVDLELLRTIQRQDAVWIAKES